MTLRAIHDELDEEEVLRFALSADPRDHEDIDKAQAEAIRRARMRRVTLTPRFRLAVALWVDELDLEECSCEPKGFTYHHLGARTKGCPSFVMTSAFQWAMSDDQECVDCDQEPEGEFIFYVGSMVILAPCCEAHHSEWKALADASVVRIMT